MSSFFLSLRFFFAFQISQYFIFPTNFIKMSYKSNNLLATFSPRKLYPNPRKVRIYFLVYFILFLINLGTNGRQKISTVQDPMKPSKSLKKCLGYLYS